MTREEVTSILKPNKEFTIMTEERVHHLHKSSSFLHVVDGLRIDSMWGGYLTIDYANIKRIVKGIVGNHISVSFGSDPELFFVKDGVMVPSTGIMPADRRQVTRDGFQVELHPDASSCRQLASNYIRDCLREAREIATGAGAQLSFALAHTVDPQVWKQTDKSVKKFGCNPTLNVHEKKQKRTTGLRERFRAGGGHIHLGSLSAKVKNDLPTLVKLFDIIAGNTLVLIDRDERNITRRKNYGRAGEYREKPYGLEYRVPSNFWLRHYVLHSLVNGLLRNAVTYYHADLAEEIISRFDMKKVRDAINNNDFGLAMDNFKIYTQFLEEVHLPLDTGITLRNYKKFIKWAELPDSLSLLNDGSDRAILNHWCGLAGTSDDGFEQFINKVKLS
jgi:hypothetical protein